MTASPHRPIRRPSCSAISIASMACPAAIRSRHRAIAAPTASSPTEAGFEPMTTRTSQSFSRSFRMAGVLVGVAVALRACVHDNPERGDAVPGDYRLRHPIAVEEANQSIVVFVGRGRGGLTAEQRADVVGVAQSWMQAGTGVIN